MSACVMLESPYAGDIPLNVKYARLCMADCLRRGEAPLPSHLLYTQPHVLRDEIEEERAMGIAAGYQWGAICDFVVVYTDLGVSEGMKKAITIYKELRKNIVVRTLPNWEASHGSADDSTP